MAVTRKIALEQALDAARKSASNYYAELLRTQDKLYAAEDRINQVRHAVTALMLAAFWHADRPCDAHELWAELKRAALVPTDPA